MDANVIVILISLTLFLAYISGILYAITGIPDIIWLISLGVIFGPLLHIFNPETLKPITPILVVMALNLLMFEAGLAFDFNTFRENMKKSSYLGLITFLLTMITIGYGLHLAFPHLFELSHSLLFGAMFAGTSSSIVLNIMSVIQQEHTELNETRRFLFLESIVTDSLSIVTAMTLLRIISMPGVQLYDGFKDIVYVLFISSLIGLVVGVLWVQFLDLVRNRPFNYIMTIATLFLAYFLSETAGGPGAGPLAALTFGITMTNYPLLARHFNLRERVRVERRKLRSFHEEITFLVKSFLFIFVGLEAKLTLEYLFLGGAIAIVVGVTRILSVYLTNLIEPIGVNEQRASRLLFSNGLTALVISQLPIIIDQSLVLFNEPEIYSTVAVIVVVSTALFGSIAGPYLIRIEKIELETKEIEETA